MKSSPVSRREAEVIDAIREKDIVVFGPRDVERYLDITRRNAYRILGRMHEKDLVRRVGQGTYVLTSVFEELDSYAIASQLEPASYIGFWSALHFHGMTDQVPSTIFVAVTKSKRSRRIQGQDVRFVRIDPSAFFGYDRYGETVVSDREKTIIDCLRLPDHAGGITHVNSCLPADLDVDRIIRYAKQLESGAVAARLGYLLERADLLDGRDDLQSLVSSYTKLDPEGDRTNPIAAWNLYANVDLADGAQR